MDVASKGKNKIERYSQIARFPSPPQTRMHSLFAIWGNQHRHILPPLPTDYIHSLIQAGRSPIKLEGEVQFDALKAGRGVAWAMYCGAWPCPWLFGCVPSCLENQQVRPANANDAETRQFAGESSQWPKHPAHVPSLSFVESPVLHFVDVCTCTICTTPFDMYKYGTSYVCISGWTARCSQESGLRSCCPSFGVCSNRAFIRPLDCRLHGPKVRKALG